MKLWHNILTQRDISYDIEELLRRVYSRIINLLFPRFCCKTELVLPPKPYITFKR